MKDVLGIMLTAVVLVVVGAGCGPAATGPQRTIETELRQADQRKVELLAEIEQHYENPRAHYELGRIYHADGLWSKAAFHFVVTIDFDPANYLARAALLRTLVDGGKEQKADMIVAGYIKQASYSAKQLLILGRAMQWEKLDKYAMDCYEKALEIAPNSAMLYKQLGYYYLSRKDRVRAEEYLRKSFNLDPYQPEVAGELGRMGIVIEVPRDDKESDTESKTQAPK